jgi:chromosome condensin MukBEF complex kleisin-like MukF subunit
MSNDSIIAELEEQMASAAFNQLVEQHIGSIDITIMLAARVSNVPSDVLIVILAAIIGKILINECPDNARQHYADIAKHVIDEAVRLSNKE